MIIREDIHIGRKLKETCERMIMDGHIPYVVMSDKTLQLLKTYSDILFQPDNSFVVDGCIERHDDMTYSYFANWSTDVPFFVDDRVGDNKFLILEHAKRKPNPFEDYKLERNDL